MYACIIPGVPITLWGICVCYVLAVDIYIIWLMYVSIGATVMRVHIIHIHIHIHML